MEDDNKIEQREVANKQAIEGSNESQLHFGHRQRLKEKVKNYGVKSLAVHEVLELLLTYTIARKDTNKLAHQLIDKFEGFSQVLDASFTDLKKQVGVGTETAIFLTMLPDIFEIYKQERVSSSNIYLKTTRQCVDYFRSNFEIKGQEYLYVVCLNKACKMVDRFEVKGVDDCTINLDLKELAEKIAHNSVTSIVIFHTHPNGEASPSEQDIATTQSILNMCAMLRIGICDHIILNEVTHYSFGRAGKLGEMYDKFFQVFTRGDSSPFLRQVSKFSYN